MKKLTKRQAAQKTIERWEAIVEAGGRDVGGSCGFCDHANNVACSDKCILYKAIGKHCLQIKPFGNWLRSPAGSSEEMKWAKRVLAYLKRLSKREGWI